MTGRFEARFYETYYFASVVKNVLTDRFAYLRYLDEFYGDGVVGLLRPYRRFSAFHVFLVFVIYRELLEEPRQVDLELQQRRMRDFAAYPAALEQYRPTVLPINEALDQYGIDHTGLEEWLEDQGVAFTEATQNDISAYYDHLVEDGAHAELANHASRDLFFVLFQNRRLLLLFNDIIAGKVREIDPQGLPPASAKLFAAPGVLHRADIPRWAERAVFFRDRGRCVLCDRDISGRLSPGYERHYDHMVPLAKGGLNDVSNLQLLCGPCNRSKRDDDGETSDFYEAWYPLRPGSGL